MSLIRSWINIKPSSSIIATSPVLSQPSTRFSEISSGRFQYSPNTVGPLQRTSPTSPLPVTVAFERLRARPSSLVAAKGASSAVPTEDGHLSDEAVTTCDTGTFDAHCARKPVCPRRLRPLSRERSPRHPPSGARVLMSVWVYIYIYIYMLCIFVVAL